MSAEPMFDKWRARKRLSNADRRLRRGLARYTVERFGDLMLNVLTEEKNVRKRQWPDIPLTDLFDMVRSKLGELRCEVFDGPFAGSHLNRRLARIGEEAIHLANLAMMVEDKCRRLRLGDQFEARIEICGEELDLS